MSKNVNKKCPHCGSRITAPILYGMPAYTKEMQDDVDNKRLYLGGCCISEFSPKYHCFGCDRDFGTPAIYFGKESKMDPFDESTWEHYLDIVKDVTLSVTTGYGVNCQIEYKAYESEGRYYISGRIFPKNEDPVEISERKWKNMMNKMFNALFIHEWEEAYIDHDVLDGCKWNLEIKMTGDRVKRTFGLNEYPGTFDGLINLVKKTGRSNFAKR